MIDQHRTGQVNEGSLDGQSQWRSPGNLPALPPIPGGRYTDPDFLRLEQQHLWKKSWLYACHADQVPCAGDYLLWNPTGSPIIIVRDTQGVVRAFYNVCRHRAAPLVTDDTGTVSGGFTCGYHGWSYGLDGRLLGVRARRDFPELDLNSMGLVPVACDSLGKWIFVNEDPEARPLQQSLEPVASQLAAFEPENTRHVASRNFDIDCNVKVLLEGFLEVYHLSNIHSGTVDRFLDYRGTTHSLFRQGHSVMVTPHRNPDWIDPGTLGMKEFSGVDDRYRKTNVSFNIFPNLITPLSPTGMPFLTLLPRGDNRMRLKLDWFSPDWGEGERHPLWDRRMENFVRILEEDLRFIPLIQNSMASTGFKNIQPGYAERRIYHWHEELDRRIGVERIPGDLRVVPCLESLLEQ